MKNLGTLICIAMLSVSGGVLLNSQSKKQTTAPAASEVLLPDIDPISLSRLPPIKREQMDESGKKVYDAMAGERGSPAKTGPNAIALYSPEIAEPLRRMNQYLRFNGVVDKRYRELAILVAIREMNQKYQWSGHEGGTLAAGVPQSTIDVVKYGNDVAGLGEKEATIIQAGRQLFREKGLSSDLYRKATTLFGTQGMVELVALMGSYAMTGLMCHAVDQQVPLEDGHHVAMLPDLDTAPTKSKAR